MSQTWLQRRHPPQALAGLRSLQDPSQNKPQQHSRLLGLPRELRDQIYGHTLGGPHLVHVTCEHMLCPAGPQLDEQEDGNGISEEEKCYTNDVYFNGCSESVNEPELYERSQVEDPADPYDFMKRKWRAGRAPRERHEHCHGIRSGTVFESATLQTCRQIYQEATTVLWSQCIFSVQYQSVLTDFIDQMAPLHKLALTTLHISIDWRPGLRPWIWAPHELKTALASLTSFRKLHVSLQHWKEENNLQILLEKLKNDSLPIWHELKFFHRPSLKRVTVVIQDLQSERYEHRRLTFCPWRTAEKATLANALADKLLAP